MASHQQQRSRIGQGTPIAPGSIEGNPTEAISSGTQPSRNNINPISPRTRTVEEPPSPTVDNVDSDPNQFSSYTQEPQRRIAEMERDREKVLNTPFKARLVSVITLLARAIFHAWFQGSGLRGTSIFLLVLSIGLAITWYSVIIIPAAFIITSHCILALRRLQKGRIQSGQLGATTDLGIFLIVCGSGGHTNEMLRMLGRSLNLEDIGHRRWAIGADDALSNSKVLDFERRTGINLRRKRVYASTFNVTFFNRARRVHQGWGSTVATAIKSMCDVLEIIIVPPTKQRPYYQYPNVIVTDGPGTGFLFLLAAHVLKLLCIVPEPFLETIYVESWARVKSLSLSATLVKLFQVADVFVTQHRPVASPEGRDFTQNIVAMPAEPPVRVPRKRLARPTSLPTIPS
ncbi:oligosaccharide biosynthesis protein Alg14 like-domain-containing protein [Hypoxylon sp. FL1284]|nr:oligosaccharide biosynthesis protein Alg14 like-domain-containing protein [Hypoxylon sp. FL1284]